MAELPSVFVGVSSLPDDYDFEMRECRFGRDPGYQDGGVTIFMCDLLTDNPDYGDNGTIHWIKSIGDGWEAQDKGASVVHKSGKERGFNSATNFQRIVDRCLELDSDMMLERFEKSGFPPQDARFWEGLKGHMTRQTIPVKFSGKTEDKEFELPSELHGWGETETPKPAKKAASKKKAAVKAETNGGGDVSAEVKAQIRAIADECDEVEEFVTRAFTEVDGIDESDAIQGLVTDYDDDTSIWAEAVAAAS